MFIHQNAWEKMKGCGRLQANANLTLREKPYLPSWRKCTHGYLGVSCEHHPQEFHPSQDAGASWCLKEVFVKAMWSQIPCMLWLYGGFIVILLLSLINSHARN